MYVYKCRICDQVCTGQGVATHLRTTHGVRRDTHYGTKGPWNIVLVRETSVMIHGDPHFTETLESGTVVAEYLFEVTGKWNTEYKSGDREAFDEWLPERLEYLDKQYPHWRWRPGESK